MNRFRPVGRSAGPANQSAALQSERASSNQDFLTESDTSGRDRMYGGEGDDARLEGGPEGDFLYGGPGDEGFAEDEDTEMFGDAGNDRLYGGPGRDAMEGEEGKDRMYGGAGNDYIDAVDDDTNDSVDIVRCGKGSNDVALVDVEDDVKGCEEVNKPI